MTVALCSLAFFTHARTLDEMTYLEISVNPVALRCYEDKPILKEKYKAFVVENDLLNKSNGKDARQLTRDIEDYDRRWKAFDDEVKAYNEACKIFD